MSAPTTVQWLRTAVRRIRIGSGRRAIYLTAWIVHRGRRGWQRATGWLDEGEGFGWWLRLAVLLLAAALLRKILTVSAVGVYHRVEDGGAPWLLWSAAAWWIASAYRAGAEGWTPKRPAAPTPDGEPGDPEAVEEEPAAELGELARPVSLEKPPPVSPVALVAAVRDIGTPHAQLKPLAQHLGTTTDAVRAAAAGMGWPVKDVRMTGRSSTHGLRWDEVPSPAQVYPLTGVVGAGQLADDNDDDASGERPEEGLRVVPLGYEAQIIYDPRDTVRHHQVRDQ